MLLRKFRTLLKCNTTTCTQKPRDAPFIEFGAGSCPLAQQIPQTCGPMYVMNTECVCKCYVGSARKQT
eukprot:4459323-Amphidinium_carterae.1